MALNFKPLQYDQEFTYLQKKHLKTVLEGISAGTIAPQDAIAELTDSTTGTPDDTLIVLRTDSTANCAADCEDNFASLNAQINALQDALVAAGVLTA